MVDKAVLEDLEALLASAYENQVPFYLDVSLVNGRRFCLPYKAHSDDTLLLESVNPPRFQVIVLRYVTDFALDFSCIPVSPQA